MNRLLFILLLLLPLSLCAEQVSVRLYSTISISSLSLSVHSGHYRLYADDTLLLDSTLTHSSQLKLRSHKNRVALSVGSHNYGSFRSILLVADSLQTCILNYKPDNAKARSYEGGLRISHLNNGGLLLVNQVDLEAYLAGVVQSEIYGDLADIYRAQAVISRTWALRNLHKHDADGYNLCDHVHCQAYYNRCTLPDIRQAVASTAGQTLLDAEDNLIETPFHANSGGETANSEDVWRTAFPYLRSVPDTFSLGMKQSTWNKTIPLSRWLAFFEREAHLNIQSDSIRSLLTHFSQPHRQASWMGIPLKLFRSEFKLKSTFFDVSFDSLSNSVVLNGRGYGHGVGLSQEGAIRRAQFGQPYDQILLAYYPGSHLSSPSVPINNEPSNQQSEWVQPQPQTEKNTEINTTNNTSTNSSSSNSSLSNTQPKQTPPSSSSTDDDWQFDW